MVVASKHANVPVINDRQPPKTRLMETQPTLHTYKLWPISLEYETILIFYVYFNILRS